MTPEDKALCDGLRFDHVAWLRYVVDDNGGKPLRISVCGSDDAGAFRVFMVDLTFAAATRIEALSADVERLNDDLMACVAPAEVGGGIVNHVIERERKRAEQAEAEVKRLKASRDAVDAENGRLVVEVERLKAELVAECERGERWRQAGIATDRLLVAEREAHAKTRSGRDYIVAENVIAQREITERRAEVERMHVFLSQERDRSLRFRHIMEAEHTRADNLGAVIAELRAMVEQMPACDEFGTASGAMIKSAVLALIEDACREHGVTLPEVGRG